MASLEERLSSLELRNDALESRLKRWRIGGLGALAFGSAALLMGQAAPDKLKATSITAQNLVLTDAKGKPRMEIGVDKDGAGFDVRDANGKVRIALGEGKIEGLGDGAGVWIFDIEERPRVGLGLGENGSGLIILDKDGKTVDGAGKSK